MCSIVAVSDDSAGARADGETAKADATQETDEEPSPDARDEEVEETFDRTADEGYRRLTRSFWPLLGTGLVGGIDVGTGVLALLLVEHHTGSVLLAGLAFSIGFIALTMAGSELFTEDFLIPVITVVSRQARWRMLLRLWGGTLVANMVGGWIFMWLVMRGYPQFADTAIKAGGYYVDLGLGLQAFSLAVLGGAVITLMTWMQHSTASSVGVKVIPAIGAAFLLAGGQLNHIIVNSLLMFAALHTGEAPFGYAAWAVTAGWAGLGNLIGGVGLVTVLRVVQVPNAVQSKRSRPARGVPRGDERRPTDEP